MPRGVSRYDEARLQGRLWDMHHLGPKLRAWIPAYDRSFVIPDPTSGQLTRAIDKSRNGRDYIQDSAANRPGWVASSFINPTMGAIRQIETQSLYRADTVLPPQVFIVYYLNLPSPNHRTLLGGKRQTGTGYGLDAFYFKVDDPASKASMVVGNTAGASFFAEIPTLRQQAVIGDALASSSSIVRTNNVSSTATGAGYSGTLACIEIRLGAGYYNGTIVDGFNGDIGEVVETEILTADETDYVRGALAWRWASQNGLPGNFRFKNRPPLIGA